jgi:CRISPR-associated endonuclease/helicase Cas3
MYANHHGHDLVKHCQMVSRYSEYLAKKFELPEDRVEICRNIGLFHDIGKGISSFQEYITSKIEGTESSSKLSLYHHEVSWAAANNLKEELFKKSVRGQILTNIYWHHAKPLNKDFNGRKDIQSILNALEESDIISVISLVNELSNKELTLEDFTSSENISIPEYIQSSGVGMSNPNPTIILTRSIVIMADRKISSLSLEDFNNLFETNDFNSLNNSQQYLPISFEKPSNYDNRYDVQLEVARKSLNSRVVSSNSPAGFGKTLQGVLRNLISGGKTYWVCPRNAVAESVYKSILEELKALSVDIPIELYLSGERKDSNNDLEDFTSRIVVTNIDNLLSPLYKSKMSNHCLDVVTGDIIFDEYHEFVSEGAYFSLFLNLMRARNLIKSTTFLLSATPSILNTLWDTSNKTTFLPEQGKHFQAAHSKKYKISFVDDLTSLDITVEGNTLVKFNSVKNAREFYQSHRTEDSLLFHSKFISQDKKEIVQKLYGMYGKVGTNEKHLVVSAPIISASFDLSFNKALIMSESPENDIQVIGRVNRWGKDEVAELVFASTSKSNRSGACAIDKRYSKDLNKLWYDSFKNKFNGLEVTLDEIYDFYNQFNKDNKVSIKKFLEDLEIKSTKEFKDGYYDPIKMPKVLNEGGPKSSGKNLRSTQTQHSYIVKYSGSNEWISEPFQSNYVDFIGKVTNLQNIHKKKDWLLIEKAVEGLEFSFEGYYKGLAKNGDTLDTFKCMKLSKCPSSPYPIRSMEYSRELGLLDSEGDFVE